MVYMLLYIEAHCYIVATHELILMNAYDMIAKSINQSIATDCSTFWPHI